MSHQLTYFANKLEQILNFFGSQLGINMSETKHESLERCISNFQDSQSAHFKKFQKIHFCGEWVPFRYKKSEKYMMKICVTEEHESYAKMVVHYLDDDSTREFRANLRLEMEGENPRLHLGAWQEV